MWALLTLLALSPAGRSKATQSPPPLPELRPMAAPADAASRFRQAAEAAGKVGASAQIVCELLAEQLSLCAVKGSTGALDYLTQAEAEAWGLDPATLRTRLAEVALAGLREGRPAPASVDGMSGRYWVSAEADGLDAAGLLHPERLAVIAGAEPVIAVPVQGALLFWVPGDAELDKVMAVAVRRMYESSAQRVSPLIYRWKDGRFVVWGSAVRAGGVDGL